MYRQSGLIKGGEKPTRKGVFDAGIKMIFTKLGDMPKPIPYVFMEEWLKCTPATKWPEKWMPYSKEFKTMWKDGQSCTARIAEICG